MHLELVYISTWSINQIILHISQHDLIKSNLFFIFMFVWQAESF